MTGDEYRRMKKRERNKKYYEEHKDEINARRRKYWAERTDAQKLRRREYDRSYQRSYRHRYYQKQPPDDEE